VKKKIWTNDSKEVMEAINALIDSKALVSLQCKGAPALRTRISKIHFFKNMAYLLLLRPQGLGSSRVIKELLFKLHGLPILGFSCPITRESVNVLATMIPREIFQLELRTSSRHEPLKGSMATFFIRDRSRVSICKMENISMTGVKLVGTPTHRLQEKDIIGPCTLSLAGQDALINREVTVNKAVVVRARNIEQTGNQLDLGIQFELSTHEENQLKEHISPGKTSYFSGLK